MVASRLLEPGQKQALSFDVPSTPGIYPYVCTYPGHWRRMFGAMYVVENLEEYAPDVQHGILHVLVALGPDGAAAVPILIAITSSEETFATGYRSASETSVHLQTYRG